VTAFGVDGNRPIVDTEEETAAFRRRHGIVQHVHRALTRGRTIAEFFEDLVSVHERALPEYDWRPFRSMNVDEVDELCARWLDPFLTRKPTQDRASSRESAARASRANSLRGRLANTAPRSGAQCR